MLVTPDPGPLTRLSDSEWGAEDPNKTAIKCSQCYPYQIS